MCDSVCYGNECQTCTRQYFPTFISPCVCTRRRLCTDCWVKEVQLPASQGVCSVCKQEHWSAVILAYIPYVQRLTPWDRLIIDDVSAEPLDPCVRCIGGFLIFVIAFSALAQWWATELDRIYLFLGAMLLQSAAESVLRLCKRIQWHVALLTVCAWGLLIAYPERTERSLVLFWIGLLATRFPGYCADTAVVYLARQRAKFGSYFNEQVEGEPVQVEGEPAAVAVVVIEPVVVVGEESSA